MTDMVNHPPHYQSKDGSGIECIDAIGASMTPDAFTGYLKGNVEKYVFRAGSKSSALEDLKKARWYLDRWINVLEEEEDASECLSSCLRHS